MGTDLGPQPTRYFDAPTREFARQLKRKRRKN